MRVLKWLLAGMIGLVPTVASADETTSQFLKLETQRLYDAVSSGDAKTWDRLSDSDAAFTDENGVLMDKKTMVASVTPLPKGISGTIVITEWAAHFHGDTAITTHLDDEHENFHGQKLHALYRETGVWRKEPEGWRVIAMQTIALNQDPPAVALSPAVLDEYAGVYAASPDYTYTIARKGDGLVGGVTGKAMTPVKAEIKDVLFTTGQPRSRKIFERDGAGHITGFLGRREGRDVVWRKVK